MVNKFLFELGTEEIPDWMITPALDQLREAVARLHQENELECSRLVTFGTPRRLAVIAEGLPEKRPDRCEIVSGPPKSVAFDGEGQPTKAAEGFARKLGVAVSDLEVVETEKGEYISLRREISGERVPEILKEALPAIIASISWPKNMYWRESRFRYIRPLRWYVCLWNDEVVPFSFEGVESGRVTRGHRSLGHGEVEVPQVDDYAACLRREYVLVDSAERLRQIEEGLEKESGDLTVVSDEALLATVVNLNEYPAVLKGGFDSAFLDIPREVLTTVMRHHQKYFSLLDREGSLAPFFLTVLNTLGDPTGSIRQGHEKVLQARLEDAAFFWKTDQKKSLDERVEMLGHVLFQERLGSYRDKTQRLRTICSRLGESSDLDTAARLCKTDLTTEMVRELPELQGIMGGLYACNEGQDEGVWKAIYEHYQPVAFEDEVPSTESGVLLSIADRLDTIVGCFGIGITPTGSSDPFALRRLAQGLVSILDKSRLDFSLEWLVEIAQDAFSEQESREEEQGQVQEFLERRVRFLLQKQGIPYDILNALFAVGVGTVCDAGDRARALQEIRGEADFEALAAAYKRIKNILTSQEEESAQPGSELLVEKEEIELYAAYEQLRPLVLERIQSNDYLGALKEMAAIRGVVDRFFDKVHVMSDEVEVRNNRLALLNGISNVFLLIADISEIVQEGEQNG